MDGRQWRGLLNSRQGPEARMPRVAFKKIFGYLGLTGFQLDALLLTSLQKLHRFNIRFVQRMVGFRMQFLKNI
ncbi:MAG: hypothetical protein JWR26_2144 [Pedosphaera sp.]|nr:hypothetical protein [Pedosphaera sp.]